MLPKPKVFEDLMTRPAENEEHVNGIVERVVFHSEETGFGVLRVQAQGHRDLVAVVGTVPSVNAGEWVDARGRWEVDARHGRQFKADAVADDRAGDATRASRSTLAQG